MYAHIENLVNLMKEKGFDGFFLSNFGFSDFLKENLIKHAFQSFEEGKPIGPLNLTTYCHWQDESSPYVRCNFTVDFQEPSGFTVRKMSIDYGNHTGLLRKKELFIPHNSEIWHRDKVNKTILKKRRTMKI